MPVLQFVTNDPMIYLEQEEPEKAWVTLKSKSGRPEVGHFEN